MATSSVEFMRHSSAQIRGGAPDYQNYLCSCNNVFLKEVFLPQHNARFATPAEDRGTAFVPFTGALDDILCIHEERTVSNDNTVRYKRLALQIPAGRHRRHYVKARVRVHEYPDGTMAVFHGPRCLARYHADGQPIDSQTREAA